MFLTSAINLAFLNSFVNPYISDVLLQGFEDIELLFEAILTLIFVLGPILFVIGIGYLLFPAAKKIFGNVA